MEYACGTGQCSLNCVNATSCESIDVDTEEAHSFECMGYCDVSEDIPVSFSRSSTDTPGNTEGESAESSSTLSTETTSTTSTITGTAPTETTSTTERANIGVEESSLSLMY